MLAIEPVRDVGRSREHEQKDLVISANRLAQESGLHAGDQVGVGSDRNHSSQSVAEV